MTIQKQYRLRMKWGKNKEIFLTKEKSWESRVGMIFLSFLRLKRILIVLEYLLFQTFDLVWRWEWDMSVANFTTFTAISFRISPTKLIFNYFVFFLAKLSFFLSPSPKISFFSSFHAESIYPDFWYSFSYYEHVHIYFHRLTLLLAH